MLHIPAIRVTKEGLHPFFQNKNISALNLHGSLMIISNVSKSIRAANANGKYAQDNFLNVLMFKRV